MRILFVFIFFSMTFFAIGQEKDVEIVVNLRDDDTGKKLSGATVSVYANGTQVATSTSAGNGKVPTIYVPTGEYYQIFIRKSGYVTKMAELDARIDIIEDAPDPLFLNFETAIFKSIEGVDFQFLEKTAMTKFDFDSEYYYRFDKAYTDQMLKRIDELKRQIAEKKKEEEKQEKELQKTEADFRAYVDAGDKAIKDIKYETAVQQYGLALELRKDNAEVKAKLAEAQKLWDEQKKAEESQKMYAAKMLEASKAYKDEKLEEAINLYTEASALMPAEQEPKDKIEEIRAKIAEQKALDEKIEALVTAGDIAAAADGFDEAIAKYTEAIGLRDNDEVKEKLEAVKRKKEELESAEKLKQENLAQYNALMQSGQDLFDTDKLEEAKSKYTEASALLPEEVLPKDKIAEIDKLLEDKKAKEEKILAYKTKMKAADEAYGAESWEDALSLYAEAKEISPLQSEPSDRIKEINLLLEKQKAAKAEYEKFITQGDQFASTEEYEEAIDMYTKAAEIDNTDEVAEKSKKALEAMQALSESKRLARELEAKYAALIEIANTERDEDKLEEAIASYSEAQVLKPEETYPAEEIEKINLIIKERKAKEEANAQALAEYQAVIDAANKLFEDSEWEASKAKYREAISMNGEDAYPVEKVKEIDLKLAEIAEIAAQEAAYLAAMKDAKAAFDGKDYEKAIADYTKAKDIKAEEPEPQEQIEVINKILADLKSDSEKEAAYLAAMKTGDELRDTEELEKAKASYQTALSLKEGDEKATEEIEKIDQLLESIADAKLKEEQFKALVAEGDAFFAADGFEDAKAKFVAALEVRSDDQVTEKIKLCEDQLKLLSEKEAQSAELKGLIAEADELMKAQSWEEAIAKYEHANAIESSDYNTAQIKLASGSLAMAKEDALTDEKIATFMSEAKDFEAAKEFEKALNTYKAAYDLRPTPEVEEAIKKVEVEIETLKDQQLAGQKYEAKIEEANVAFSANKYQVAIDLYTEAKTLKADESFPDEQIKLCKDALAKLSEAENEEKYNEMIAKADQQFSKENFDKAVEQYQMAKLIAGEKTYPDEKIAEIKKIRDDIANAEANKIKKENDYRNLVVEGDTKYDTQNFEAAIAAYKKAQAIKAFDPYVVGRIEDAEEKLKTLNEAKAIKQKYQSFIDKADDLMAKEDWKAAITQYKEAIVFDGSNPYPKDQIALAEKAIENDSKEMSEASYQKLLADAQLKMDADELDGALTLFKSAYRQRPTDDIPSNKIRELNELIAQKNAKSSAVDQYQTLIARADKAFGNKDFKAAKKDYVAAAAISDDPYPDKRIKEIDAINNEFAEDQYSKMVRKADEYFKADNFEKAKGLYNRAIKTFTTQNTEYPKAQIKKINAILNPPSLLAGGTAKPVGEKINLTEAEIQRMFQEAGAASKNQEVNKVLTASSSAKNIINDWSAAERNAAFQAVDSLEYRNLALRNDQILANEDRQDRETDVTAISQNIKEQQTYEKEYGENVSFRQTQVVDNITTTRSNIDGARDEGRQNFIPEVGNMANEYQTQKMDQNDRQGNLLYTQVNQIKTMNEELTNKFVNADVSRANTELDVENANTSIINQSNKEAWQHEDVVYNTVNAKEVMVAEQFEARQYSDVPRQNMETIVSESGSGFTDSQQRSADQNELITSQTNDAVTTLRENITEAKKDADAGRENMEKVSNRMVENIQQSNMSQAEQNQVQVQLTDVSITELKADQQQTLQNKTDNLYEDTETITELIDDIEKKNVNDSETATKSMYISIDKVAEAQDQLNENGIARDNTAENSADVILSQQDINAKEKREVTEANEKRMNLTEDKLISIRDINVKAVTQAVKNELGMQYPEGVTEEVYQQKDEDGYLLSYVVRRVLVKDGEGNVFEKTQMKHGTSYTKNGVAISEYIWQDQTEDATLTYH